jgi:antitoxin ParD1/3/4
MASEPTTVTMNVSLPEPLKQYVDGKVSSGVYGSASEFVREAIREKYQRDRDRAEAKAVLSSKLLQGLDSGEPIPFTDDYFKRKKHLLTQRAGRKNKRS